MTKKATKKTTPKKPTTQTQKAAEALKLLEQIVAATPARLYNEELCSEGQQLLQAAARLVGSSRFKDKLTLTFCMYEDITVEMQASVEDSYNVTVEVHNLRTGEKTIQVLSTNCTPDTVEIVEEVDA